MSKNPFRNEIKPELDADGGAVAAREKYPYIVKWGRMMGSYDYYIDNQCLQAVTDKAPATAIYKDSDDGHWHTIETIKNPDIRRDWGLDK